MPLNPLSNSVPTIPIQSKILLSSCIITAVAAAVFCTLGALQLNGFQIFGHLPQVAATLVTTGGLSVSLISIVTGVGVFLVTKKIADLENQISTLNEKWYKEEEVAQASEQTDIKGGKNEVSEEVSDEKNLLSIQPKCGKKPGESQDEFKKRIHWVASSEKDQVNPDELNSIHIPDDICQYLGPANYIFSFCSSARYEVKELINKIPQFIKAMNSDPTRSDLPYILVLTRLGQNPERVQTSEDDISKFFKDQNKRFALITLYYHNLVNPCFLPIDNLEEKLREGEITSKYFVDHQQEHIDNILKLKNVFSNSD